MTWGNFLSFSFLNRNLGVGWWPWGSGELLAGRALRTAPASWDGTSKG